MKTIKKLTAILSCVAVAGSLAVTASAAEGDVTTEVTIDAYAVACGYPKEQSDNQYDAENGKIRLGGSYTSGVLGSSTSTDITGGDKIVYNENGGGSARDSRVSYLRFTLPAAVTETDTYTLTMTADGYGHYSRTGNMEIYAGIADMDTVVATGNTAQGDSWTTINWTTRPQVSGVKLVKSNVNTTKGNSVSIDLSPVLMGKSGTVTVALLSKASDTTAADSYFKDVKITRTAPAAAENTFTASVVKNSLFTATGTGEYASEQASGFIATITSNKSGSSPSSFTLNVVGENERTQSLEDKNIVIGENAAIYVGIIVNNMDIQNEDAITMTVK